MKSGFSSMEVTLELTRMRVELGLEKKDQLESHLVADAHGNPIGFKISGGQVHDSQVATDVLDSISGDKFIADKGYDSEEIRNYALAKGFTPVIPKRRNNKSANPYFDRHLYKHRHLIENLFGKIKRNRSIAMRFDKLARNFNSMIAIACTLVWIKL